MSIQAQPETIFKDLFDQVFEALKSGHADQLQLKRWDHAADRLANASRADALEIRAHLAAIREQDDEVDRLYAAALRATDDYTGAAVRYLVLLSERLRQEQGSLNGAPFQAQHGCPRCIALLGRTLHAKCGWPCAPLLRPRHRGGIADAIYCDLSSSAPVGRWRGYIRGY